MREVVDNLILEDAPALRKEEAGREGRLAQGAYRRERIAGKTHEGRDVREGAARVRRHENRGVEERGAIELIHGVGSECVYFGNLTRHLRLVALIVEGG